MRTRIITALVLIMLLSIGGCMLRPLIFSYCVDDYYTRSLEPVLGEFKSNDNLNNLRPSQFEHYAVVWKNTGVWFNKKALLTDLKNHDMLITVETWLKGRSYNNNVLTETLRGAFDSKINNLGALVAQSKHQVLVRWNPDMEVPAYTYPWQYQSPLLYTKAFNYFASKLKKAAPNVKIVWGPSGYPGDTEFWPGNKEVDYVSITLGSASEYSCNAYPLTESVPQMLKLKLHRLRFINKPIIILGSKASDKFSFKQQWLVNQAAYINSYREIIYSPANYVDTGSIKPSRTNLKAGIFDPQNRLLNLQQLSVEHIFSDMGQIQRGEFEKSFLQIVNRQHDVIVTVEPWKDSSRKADTNVTKSLLTGRYDAEIRHLFRILSKTKQTVYLRFMHEMEIPIHRYAWQSKDPVDYINAYRYFMQFEGGPGKNVKKVWGPAGDRGSIDYWPGSDVVDVISIAIYGLPDKNIADPNKQEAFETIFNRKFYRMRFAPRPIIITEFGVKGPESYQDRWLMGAAKTIKANPHVFGICYFNLYDNPKAWGGIKAPDWSISPNSMKKFLNLVEVR